MQLKKQDNLKYLQPTEQDPAKNTWTGFKPRTAAGLELLYSAPATR